MELLRQEANSMLQDKVRLSKVEIMHLKERGNRISILSTADLSLETKPITEVRKILKSMFKKILLEILKGTLEPNLPKRLQLVPTRKTLTAQKTLLNILAAMQLEESTKLELFKKSRAPKNWTNTYSKRISMW